MRRAHRDLASGLILDSALFEPTSLDDGLETFQRRGGAAAREAAAREAAARYLGGDTSPETASAWRHMPCRSTGAHPVVHGPPRTARALVNREVRARFRRGECGSLKVAADDMDKITCPVLILAGEDDVLMRRPRQPPPATRSPQCSTRRPSSRSSPTSDMECSRRHQRRLSRGSAPPLKRPA
jgi:pimeloyl-ACP methyl ester carboxylesterase